MILVIKLLCQSNILARTYSGVARFTVLMMYHALIRYSLARAQHTIINTFEHICMCMMCVCVHSLARSVAANYQIDIASSNNLFHPIFALLRVEREFATPVICIGLWNLANLIEQI
jgi:hypothetical protein